MTTDSISPPTSCRPPVVVGITGGSGAVYALRLLDTLLSAGRRVLLSVSESGNAVLRQELGEGLDLRQFELHKLLPLAGAPPAAAPLRAAWELAGVRRPTPVEPGQLTYHHHQDLLAPPASGSARTDGMVVCPCSGGTLSAIAHASAGNLIQRAAEVHLKERRKLILVPRETPLSLIQLDNLRRCAEAGAVVLPAMPGWYHGVRQVSDLVAFVVARICDQLDVPHDLIPRWGDVPPAG